MSALKALLDAKLHEIANSLGAVEPPDQAEHVCLVVQGWGLWLSAEPLREPAGADDSSLSEQERTILQALGDKTITPKQLAPKAGYPYNSRFRSAIASLKKKGRIERTPNGCRVVTPSP